MSNFETSTDQSEIRLLGWRELQAKLGGRSYSSVCRDEKAGRFPLRVRFGEGKRGKRGERVAWYEHQVDAYLLSLPRGLRDVS